MNDVETRNRANVARVELTAHKAALDAIRDGFIARWAETELTQSDVREAIWHRVQALDAIRQLLEGDLRSATVLDARANIKDILSPSIRAVPNG